MSTKIGSEPAYPSKDSRVSQFGVGDHLGVDTRTYIATRAMQGILASYANADHVASPEACATEAVRRADALLAELSKPVA